jgi:uncharacterized membrane protein YraQ (UPF0718 family)
VVDGVLLTLLAMLVLLVGAAWMRGGRELVVEGLRNGGGMLVRFSLLIAVSFLVAGLVEQLIPRQWMSRALGAESGLTGILLGTAAGMATPGGPFVSMPLAAVLLRSGAAPGPVVAFLTGWSLLAVHRLVAWEVPILGPRFALFRFAISAGLPVLAGLLARLVTRT